MIEIKRYRFRAANGKTTDEHLTIEEGEAKYPGWKPWVWSLVVERFREPSDPPTPPPQNMNPRFPPKLR